jgi:anti-repressor protein
MTTALIQITRKQVHDAEVQTVNARELHEFLENKDHFATWIKDRIEQFNFVENEDFVTFSEIPEKGRPRIEYALTLSMAKELSMVERNEKGKQARQYFIECERRIKTAFAIPQTLPEALRLAADLAEQNATLAPKAAIADRIAVADGCLSIREAAKALKVPEKKLVHWLLINGWMYRDQKGRLRGYAGKTPRYLNHKITPIPTDEDLERVAVQVLITAEGLVRLAEIFNGGDSLPQVETIAHQSATIFTA